MNYLGEQVAALRAQHNHSQASLAAATKLSTRTIYELENGRGNPTLRTLERIADYFGLELSVALRAAPSPQAAKRKRR